MASWQDGYWHNADGLKLHYRDYPGGEKRPPILCLPGLTRNARDFEGVADRLSGKWRLICVDLRGRGDSAYAPDPSSYVPAAYLQDLQALLDTLELKRIVAFGTSLGGLLTMMLAAARPGLLAGALINDIGPEIDPRGVERIRSIVGRANAWPTWLHAARFFAETQGALSPHWPLERWLIHAKRLCRLNQQGRIVLDYDMRIAEPFKSQQTGTPSLWPIFPALADVPVCTIRGGLSDILTEATLRRMKAELPQLDAVTIADVGHAPTLEEPEAVAAIDKLLSKVRA